MLEYLNELRERKVEEQADEVAKEATTADHKLKPDENKYEDGAVDTTNITKEEENIKKE